MEVAKWVNWGTVFFLSDSAKEIEKKVAALPIQSN